MNIQIKYVAILLIFTFLTKIGLSQENFASNISKSVSDDEKLLITYDIKPTNGAKSFTVVLLITYQGTQVGTSAAYGDIGSNISPGSEKAIVWYFKDDFDGDINNVEVDVFAYKENEPKAIFEIVSLSNNGYAPCAVTFKNRSEYANEYQWNFGDPESGLKNLSFEENPTHVFERGGIYSIALIARNTQSRLENTYYQSIEIKEYEPTIAGFEIAGNNQLAPATVKFKNTSENADTYQWDFGDPSFWRSNQSDKKNPDHKYKDPGTYKVSLIVKNNFSGISDTIVKEVIVEKEKEAEAGFVFTKSSDTAPSTVAFKNTSKDAERFEWDFGDPSSGNSNSSDEKNPAHLYSKPGSYTVQLSAYAKGQRNPTTYSEVIGINELPKPPEAAFTIENNNVLGPATIIFQNNSTNAEEFSWDFGDPDSGSQNTSGKENPTHTYTKAGRYKVELTASSTNFKTKSKATDYVIIVEPSQPPVANFTFDSENLTSPVEVTFTNISVNADSYSWNFGDPQSARNTSSEKSPGHTYDEPGKYKVVLTATNKKTGEKSSFSEFVIVNESSKPDVVPVADFSIENNNAPSPALVKFTDQSTNAHSYKWNFGDENSDENTSVLKNPVHIYSEPGRYMVTLIAKNDKSGKTDEFTEFVVVTSPAKPAVRPVAEFSVETENTTAPATVRFTNQSADATNYKWDFGDPGSENNSSGEANPTHTYNEPGRYRVELKVTNSSSGLTNTYSDFITVSEAVIVPVADFEIQNNNSEAPATVVFSNKSENANSFAWEFGDPASGSKNTSTQNNPEHVYEKPGNYTVELAVLNKKSGREDVIKKTVKIKKPLEPPVADFEITFNGEYVPINIDFKNHSENADSFKWNFGDFDSDNNESSEKVPSHYYTSPGNYTISLEAANSQTGEKDEISKMITLKSDFNTFISSEELRGKNERAFSVILSNNDEYIVLMNNQGNNSSILKMNNNGKIIDNKRLDYHLYDGISGEDGVILVGIDGTDILIQNIEWNLNPAEPVIFQQNKNFKTDFAMPLIARAKTDEIGIVVNTINDRYPIDILFQKTDKSGRIIPLVDRTFKYVGTKLATDLISTDDGGFAVTGYWKEKEDSPTMILFGKIDRKGHGEIQLISSDMNILGYNIEKSYQGGYAVLRAKESLDNNALYEISFILIDSEGGPTDCSTLLPCSVKEEDVLKYKPVLIQSENGYVIASHSFNGLDYDIMLFWIDKTGNILEKYENITLPGDQFVMDFKQTNDGGFIIAGAQNIDNQQSAVIIKTDSFGKINPKD